MIRLPHSPWRQPAAETTDYPDLWVWDDRCTGSITIGQSRLPVWAISTTAIRDDWDEVERGWEPSRYGYTENDFEHFVHALLDQRLVDREAD